MARYNVTFTRIVEIQGHFTVSARSLSAASEKASDLIGEEIMLRPLTWAVAPGKPVVTWKEGRDIHDNLDVEPV